MVVQMTMSKRRSAWLVFAKLASLDRWIVGSSGGIPGPRATREPFGASLVM